MKYLVPRLEKTLTSKRCISCFLLLENGEDAEWVDLLLNPERYTGYQGKGAGRIWGSIYKENCFLPNKKLWSYDDLNASFLSKTCLEKRVFYRTLSGLHASISVHLSYKHLMQDSSFSKPRFAPNLQEFKKRFDAETTMGNGMSRKNFFYSLNMYLFRQVSSETNIS